MLAMMEAMTAPFMWPFPSPAWCAVFFPTQSERVDGPEPRRRGGPASKEKSVSLNAEATGPNGAAKLERAMEFGPPNSPPGRTARASGRLLLMAVPISPHCRPAVCCGVRAGEPKGAGANPKPRERSGTVEGAHAPHGRDESAQRHWRDQRGGARQKVVALEGGVGRAERCPGADRKTLHRGPAPGVTNSRISGRVKPSAKQSLTEQRARADECSLD